MCQACLFTYFLLIDIQKFNLIISLFPILLSIDPVKLFKISKTKQAKKGNQTSHKPLFNLLTPSCVFTLPEK